MRDGNKKYLEIPNISHCCLLPYINDCNYIDSILERGYIRFLYNIFNSENQLYTLMIKYIMHKYKFDMHQWYGSITPLFNKIDLHITSQAFIGDKCLGMAIRVLCNIRDGIDPLPIACNYKALIE